MGSEYLNELFGLSGNVAVVTGGGGVLCGTLSRALGKVGVKVAVLDLFLEAAEKVVADIAAGGGEAIAVQCVVLREGGKGNSQISPVTRSKATAVGMATGMRWGKTA